MVYGHDTLRAFDRDMYLNSIGRTPRPKVRASALIYSHLLTTCTAHVEYVYGCRGIKFCQDLSLDDTLLGRH